MVKKARVKKTQGTAGGAAAAGGMNFQERVAALALVHFLIGSDDRACPEFCVNGSDFN